MGFWATAILFIILITVAGASMGLLAILVPGTPPPLPSPPLSSPSSLTSSSPSLSSPSSFHHPDHSGWILEGLARLVPGTCQDRDLHGALITLPGGPLLFLADLL